MKKIVSYAGSNTKFLVGAVALLFLSTLVGIAPYFFMNEILIAFLEGTAVWSTVLTLIIWVGVALVMKSILYGAGLGLSHIGAFNTLYNMRMTFAKDMAHQPMGHIMDEGTGKYKKTFVEDISLLESCLAHMIPEGVPYVFGSLVGIIVVFIADWRLGLATVIMVPISMAPMAFMMKVGLEKMPQYFASRDLLNLRLIEYVSGMEVIKIFNKTGTSYAQLEQAVNDSTNFTLDWCKVSWKSCAILYSVLPCTLLLPLPVGIYLYQSGSITLSSLTLAIMICLSLSEPLTKLVNFMPSIPQLNYAIEKIEGVFKHEDVQNGDFATPCENNDVDFKNVTFAYKEKDVISDLSLTIPQGSMCALVGASGSGKSTLAKLLMHFWDVKDGKLTIGGRDIRDFTFDNLMNHLAYVSQENTLFEGTIFDNIAVAKEGISREEVEAACKKANCHDFIMGLSHGYDTNVGTLGGKLSGGERQRITIARAMVKNAPIVILDEATAFADAENEFLIQEALSSLLVGKTVLVIAHKLHTITDVNQIVVLEGGHVLQAGTHDSLLENCPLYQHLWAQNQKSINWNVGGEADA